MLTKPISQEVATTQATIETPTAPVSSQGTLARLFSGWFSSTTAPTAPSLTNQVTPSSVRGSQKVSEAVQNQPIHGWKEIKTGSNALYTEANSGPLRFNHTQFSRQIHATDSWTLSGNNIRIGLISYGALKSWEGLSWISATQNDSTQGLLTFDEKSGASSFITFPDFPSGAVPLLVPGNSKSGENGYACIFESNLNSGVSTWDLSAETPKKLFSQTDFESVFFFDEKYFIGFKLNSKNMECWNLETQKLEYTLEGWQEDAPYYMVPGPYNQKNQILLANQANFTYAFNLETKKFLYSLDLMQTAYHTVLVGDNLFYCRAYSDPTVTVYDIVTGEIKSSFKVGGDQDPINSDDYPMAVNGNAIFGLKEDRKTICQWNAEDGKVEKEFAAAEYILHGIYYAEDKVIGWYQYTEEENLRYSVVIWDAHSGEIQQTINSVPGNYLAIQNIEDGKLILASTPIRSEGNKTQPSEKMACLTSDSSSPKNTNMFYPMAIYGWLKLEVWDIRLGLSLGFIKEIFSDNEGLPVFCYYSKGQLRVDLVESVMIQKLSL